MTLYNTTCDFCGGNVPSTDELTIIPVDRFEVPNVISNMGWGWGACRECAPLLEACTEADSQESVRAAVEALADHAMARHEERDPTTLPLTTEKERQNYRTFVRNNFCIVYSALLVHQNGPLRPWDPAIDETGEES